MSHPTFVEDAKDVLTPASLCKEAFVMNKNKLLRRLPSNIPNTKSRNTLDNKERKLLFRYG